MINFPTIKKTNYDDEKLKYIFLIALLGKVVALMCNVQRVQGTEAVTSIFGMVTCA